MLDMQQKSDEWIELRKTKITGTDAAILMGVSPYSTSYQLMQEKLNLRPPKPYNSAMQRGNLMEEELRKDYNVRSGMDFIPAIKLNGEFLMASLDGLTFMEDGILEIKTCNKKVFAELVKGTVPEHWYAQMQHQLATVPTAKCVHLYAENSGEKYVHIVERDDEYIANMLEKEAEFYKLMLLKELPEQSEKDIIEIKDNPLLENLIREFKILAKVSKEYEEKSKEVKKHILEYTDDGNCKAYGLKMIKSYTQCFDYKKACEDAKIDLKPYAKPLTIRWTFSEEKEE